MPNLVRRNTEALLRRTSRINEVPTTPQKRPVDCFELRITPTNLTPDLYSKITKATHQEVQATPNNNRGIFELRQSYFLNDVQRLGSLTSKQLEQAYLEGIYVAERYCALVDPDNIIRNNAEAWMAKYLDYTKHNKHDEKKLYWVKKDYKAGTDGEDVEADALLLRRAKGFCRRVRMVNLEKNIEKIHKEINHIIKKDSNALAAFIALRRALLI